MNACINTNATSALDELESTINGLSSSVTDLLNRVTNIEPALSYSESGVRFSSPLSFPDGIGDGNLLGELFRYRNEVRLDIRIDHNRVFASSTGAPTDRMCFLNDYIASITMAPGTEEIPSDFARDVVAGVSAARDAVRRHNKNAQAPWNEVRVAAREPTSVV